MRGLQLAPHVASEALMQPNRFLRLLLIEDVDDLQAILRFSLETISGWQVITVEPTQDWLTTAQEALPDLILLDAHPHDSDILAQLKTSFLTQTIPIVCLVSRDRLADQLQAQQAGAAAIISKPFDPMFLIQTILAIFEP
ncbi:MAG: response regulator [Leptolyngbya sp. SIO1D8]|nr:response regulator [Leptolyngbya sp. SIO1D8]